MKIQTRRSFLCSAAALAVWGGCAHALTSDDSMPVPPLSAMIRHPLLRRSLYRLAVSKDFTADGAAGTNCEGYRWIEEQRQGAEWIVRGLAVGKDDWVQRGWLELDWGLGQQRPDGAFASEDGFHSTSFFVEALARSCILDPDGAREERVRSLERAARWLTLPEIEEPGARRNAPMAHRRYILAAALGQSAAVTGDKSLARRAASWAREGIGLQQDDGVNPEKGGLDVSYQMVGVLMALRYLPVCVDAELRMRLRAMVRRAMAVDLARQHPNGSIDATGSTRIGKEKSRAGVVKQMAYGEMLQALVYGAQALPKPEWIPPAEKIVEFKHWARA